MVCVFYCLIPMLKCNLLRSTEVIIVLTCNHKVLSANLGQKSNHPEERVLWLLLTANIPSSLILVTLMMEALHSSEMSVLTTATRCNIPGDGILHSYRHANFKSYIALTGWTL
jgi:broad-specificity NMP kinase